MSLPYKKIKAIVERIGYQTINLTWMLSSGILIKVDNRMEWIIYNDIFAEGGYDESLIKLIHSKNQIIHVVDLGSNVGFFFLRLLHLARILHSTKKYFVRAVDGSERLCQEAKQRLNASKAGEQFHVDVIHGLVGSKQGFGALHEFDSHGLNSVFRKNGKAKNVSFLNLSETFAPWEKIDLLKCDIEGSELNFLENYPDILEKTTTAVFEFHPEFCDYQRCYDLLIKSGFRRSKILQQYENGRVEEFEK